MTSRRSTGTSSCACTGTARCGVSCSTKAGIPWRPAETRSPASCANSVCGAFGAAAGRSPPSPPGGRAAGSTWRAQVRRPRAEPAARRRHHLCAAGGRLVRVRGVRRRRIRQKNCRLGRRLHDAHRGAAAAGAGTGHRVGARPRRDGGVRAPFRPRLAVYKPGVFRARGGIRDAAVDRHGRRLLRQRAGRTHEQHVQARADLDQRAVPDGRRAGIRDHEVRLVVQLETAARLPGLQDTGTGRGRVLSETGGTNRLTIEAEQKSGHFSHPALLY